MGGEGHVPFTFFLAVPLLVFLLVAERQTMEQIWFRWPLSAVYINQTDCPINYVGVLL